MRHLLDTYIQAEPSQVVAKFEDKGLVELFVEGGLESLQPALPEGIRSTPEAMAEAIENNIRKLIIDEQPVNPRYYERMSQLLDELIAQRKAQALEYKAYLQRLQQLAEQVKRPEATQAYPSQLDTPAKRALYDNLGQDVNLALHVDRAIRSTKKDNWRGHIIKEREVLYAIHTALGKDENTDEKAKRILEIAKQHDEY